MAAAGGVRDTPMFSILEWACFNLVSGTYPPHRMLRKYGEEEEEGERGVKKGRTLQSNFAGKPFGFRTVLTAIKAGGSEHGHAFTFPLWSDVDYPCFKCCCTTRSGVNVDAVDGVSDVQLPWHGKTLDDF